MKAVVIREHGGPEVLRLEDLPEPTPRADQVLVDVRAIGLNHLDTWVRRGVPGHSFPLPMIPGCDFAGVVLKVGDAVDSLVPGDRVLAAPGFSCGRCGPCLSGRDNLCDGYGIFGETVNGGCAERACLPAVNALPIPEGLSFEQAAAFPLAFLTAWNMLVRRCEVSSADWVLVHAAGSGVGSAAVQIAKLHGARVIATAGSEAKRAAALDLGADHVIDYSQDDWPRQVKTLVGRRGVDVVFEHVGEATIEGSMRCLARGGRLVTCGATTGPHMAINLQHLSTMGSRGDLVRIIDLVARGLLKPVVDRVLPLDQVADAHRAMGAREQFGKIVLVPGANP